MKSTRFTRLLSGMFGVIVAAAALSGAGTTAATAAATTATTVEAASSSTGGTITRSEIIRRAQYWVDQQVTYGTLRCCPDADGDRQIVSTTSVPDSSGKSYRTDCSGLIAMAWHLNNSPSSTEFLNGTGVARTVLASHHDLKPGDALVKNGHIELFSHWKDDNDHSQGAFVYSFNNYGETVQNPHAVTGSYTSDSPNHAPYTDPAPGTYHATGHPGFNGWSSNDALTNYTPIRYNNVIDDMPAQSSGAVVHNGTLYEFVRGTDNTVKYSFAHDDTGWSGMQTIGGTITSEPVAAAFNGMLYVFARGTDGTIKYWYAYDNTGWAGMQTIGGSISGPISTAVFDGTLYVFAIGTDNTVKYWFAHDNTGWSGMQTVGGSVSGAVGAGVFDGTLYVFARGTDGVVRYWYAYNNTGWSGTQTLSGSVSGGLSSTVFNETFYVFARGAGGSVKYWYAYGGPWSGMQTLATQA
jgi:hypothetical protein